MNHLKASFTGRNHVWRYLVMLAAVMIVANTVGALPIFFALVVRSAQYPLISEGFAANPSNLTLLGIDPVTGLAMMIFPFITALFAYALLIKPLNYRTFKTTFNGTGIIRWKHFFISAFVWIILSSIYFFLFLKIEPSNFSLNNTSTSILILSILVIFLIPFQATFEEVIFRGYLMQGFAVLVKNRWFPIIMTSLLFGLMHSFNPEVQKYGFITMVPQYVLFGLIFGVITVLDDGIEAAMGAHTSNNVFLSIMITSDSSALQTPALYEQHKIYPWTEFTVLLIAGLLLIIILKIIFKWDSYSILFKKIE